MQTVISFDLSDGFLVESVIRFKDGFSSVPSASDYAGEHILGLPRKTGDTLFIKIIKQ